MHRSAHKAESAGMSRKKQASSSSPDPPQASNDPSPLPVQTMDAEEELNVSAIFKASFENSPKKMKLMSEAATTKIRAS